MASTMAEAMYEALLADATFMALATGGVYLVDEPDHAQVGTDPTDPGKGVQHPINPTDTPSAYAVVAGGSVKRLKPCAMVTTSTETTEAAGEGRRTFVHVYFYDRVGYARTRAMRERARVVLHNLRASADGKGVEVQHLSDMTNTADDSLIGGDGKRPVSMERAHYQGLGRW